MVLLTPVPSFVPKNAHLEFYQLYNGSCVHFLPPASPKFCSCIQKQTLAIKTSEVDQNLWTATDVKTKGRWRCLKLFTRSHPLGVPWHWNDLRVLHEACLTADYTDRPATATNTQSQPQMHQDAQTKSTKTGTHTITRCMDVSTTHACADEHTRASYWKPTLLDCFNSFSFDWWKVFFFFSFQNITAAPVCSNFTVALRRNGWRCTIFSSKLNFSGLHGAYLADGAYLEAVYLD